MSDREALSRLVELAAKWRDDASKMLKSGWLQSIRRDAMERCADELEALLREGAAPQEPSAGLSLSMQSDPLAISQLLDDNTREKHLYHEVTYRIRQLLGEDGLQAQLTDLPDVVARALRAQKEPT